MDPTAVCGRAWIQTHGCVTLRSWHVPHGGVNLSALLKKGGIWRDGGKWGHSLCSGATISKGSGVRVPEARLHGAAHEERRGGEALSEKRASGMRGFREDCQSQFQPEGLKCSGQEVRRKRGPETFQMKYSQSFVTRSPFASIMS